MPKEITESLLFLNFFFLALALLAVYYYAYRLKHVLRRSEALRKVAQKYQDLFNTTWDGVFVNDKDGKFISINNAGAKILGFKSAEEMLAKGTTTRDFYLSDKQREDLFNQMLKWGFVQSHLLEINKHGGERGFIELTTHLIKDKDGQISGFDGIFRDVTFRVKAEKELKEYSENLEYLVDEKSREIIQLESRKIHLESLASLGQMVAIIVHEIRNPLSSVKMGLTTLNKRARLDDSNEQCLTLARDEVSHLERILKDLLSFAKPLDIQSESKDINTVLEHSIAQMQPAMIAEGIAIEKDLAENIPHSQIDAGRLEQVFYNLLLNAKEASPEGGNITARTRINENEKTILIEIEDQGQGMAPVTVEKIWDPFYSSKPMGTGLGLTVVKTIVEAHGGQIEIESELYKGTIMKVEIPYD